MPTGTIGAPGLVDESSVPAALRLQERRVSANFAAVVVKHQTNTSDDHDDVQQHDDHHQPHHIVINANVDESPVDD